MSVKKELDNFFAKFLEWFQETPDGLPRTPRRKDIDQAVYVGESNAAGWCKWQPLLYGQHDVFLKFLDMYGIEKNMDIVDYFSSYHFLDLDIKYNKKIIGISAVDPRDDYQGLKQVIRSYSYQDGKIPYLPLGIDQGTGLNVVVEVKTGIVKSANYETMKMRKIAPSLEEFIKGWEPMI